MSWNNLVMLAAVLAPVAAIFAAHRRRPAVLVPRLGSRLEYPTTWKLMGAVFLASAGTVFGLWAAAGSHDGLDTTLLMGLLLGVSGAYTSFESFSTWYLVTATGLEKHTLWRHDQIRWGDVRTLQVVKGQDAVNLTTLSSEMKVPGKLLNLAVFTREALASIPQEVQQAWPAAVTVISGWRE